VGTHRGWTVSAASTGVGPLFFFSSRRRHTRSKRDWSSDVCSSDLPEYREALDFFKKLYDEGLVNEDFAVKDPSKWHDEFINGNAGMVVDVADAANRNFKKMKKDDDSLDDDAVDLFPAVEGPNGLYNLPSSGYNLMLAISKTDVETEDELRDVLEFMDK